MKMATLVRAATIVVVAGLLSIDTFGRSPQDRLDSMYDGEKYVVGQQLGLVQKVPRPQARPAKTSKPSSTLTSIHYRGGHVRVAAKYADRFECLFDKLEESGYKIDSRYTGGWRAHGTFGACSPPRSMHPCGYAVDINQLGRDRITRQFPANINQIARSCGLFHGAEWSWADRGHFEVRTSVAWSKQPRPALPVEVAAIGDVTMVRMEDDRPRVTLARLDKSDRVNAQAMLEAAVAAGVDPVYQLSMSYMESSFSTTTKPKCPRGTKCTAFGLCQLLEWERDSVYKIGMSTVPSVQAKACALKSKENRNLWLDIVQQEPTLEDMYLIHWQGIGGAILIKLARPDEKVEDVLNRWHFHKDFPNNYGSAVVKRNAVMRGMTVAKYLEHIDHRTDAAVKLVSE